MSRPFFLLLFPPLEGHHVGYNESSVSEHVEDILSTPANLDCLGFMTQNRWNQFDDEEEARRWVSQQTAMPTADSQQWLLCLLDAQFYGIAVAQVVQMVRYTHSTPLPHLPPYLVGLFNLQGEVIPVLDLRLRFELPVAESATHTILVVVRVTPPPEGSPNRQIGVLVDAVTDLVFLSAGEIHPPKFSSPLYTAADGRPLIVGVARQGEREIQLLDVDAVLSKEEMLVASCRDSKTEPTHA